MRYSIGAKIYSGLLLITLVGVMAMAVIFAGLLSVASELDKLSEDEHRMTAAAYEMEVNVNGIGLAALKYLDKPDPKYRNWVTEDERDFERFSAIYAGLANTREEQQLGQAMATLYVEYKLLATRLMNLRDRQRELIAELAAEIETVDRYVGRRGRRLHYDAGMGDAELGSSGEARKDHLVANMQSETAEVGYWVTSYLFEPKPGYKRLAEEKLKEFEQALRQFEMLSRDTAELRAAVRLARANDKMRSLVDRTG